MEIRDLYKTEITCPNYNISIDSIIFITVKLVDFNNNALKDKSVTLKCSQGEFDNGQKTISATVSNNGTAQFSWTATEWGVCTFSCNNSQTQVFVSGFREISLGLDSNNQPNPTYKCYVDESTKTVQIIAQRTNVTIINDETYKYNYVSIPEKYRPPSHIVQHIGRDNDLFMGVWDTGEISITSFKNAYATNVTFNTLIEYHYK